MKSASHVYARAAIYVVALFAASLAPYALGFAGRVYAATALVAGLLYLGAAITPILGAKIDNHGLFRASVLYITVIFIALAADYAPS